MENKKILMLYTGGTVGMLHKNTGDPKSPLIPAHKDALYEYLPVLKNAALAEMNPIDSSDMNPDYWFKIAEKIRENYEDYDGFVILHGTDTMAYTASALSFLFENLGKPVVLTGSVNPLSAMRGDAVSNVTGAVNAALSGIPEVCVFFGGLLLRGNRARKLSTDGFGSPNFSPLCEVNAVKTPYAGLKIGKPFCKNAALVTLFPGISGELLRNIFGSDIKGVVMLTYGAGNAPASPDFLSAVEYAVNKGIVIVNVTQCASGRVEPGLYDASTALTRLGVIGGADMTPEAALTKLMYLFGQGFDTHAVKTKMTENLRGEISN